MRTVSGAEYDSNFKQQVGRLHQILTTETDKGVTLG